MAPVSGSGDRGEADDATRGSAVRLAAEVASRLLLFGTTVLLSRRLGAAEWGSFGELSLYALLLAELGELGLQTLASRALVADTLSLRSLVRARLVSGALAVAVALAALPAAPALSRLIAAIGRALGSSTPASVLDGAALAALVGWFVLSGWVEFFGVALRCRRRRRSEAVLLLVLRASGLTSVAVALLAGAALRGVAVALTLSTLPALALGSLLLRRTPAARAPEAAPGAVLRESAPLAVHGGLLLLSPRVEFLVLILLAGGQAVVGLFLAALSVYWFLGMVPSAISAGAMPALTREALRGEGSVRRRTSATLALLAAPAGVGLALVATPLVRLVFGSDYAGAAAPLVVMSAGVPALFLNALMCASLVAAGRAAWLPWLTATRVTLAFGFALALVPSFAALGAAIGLVCAEWLLLALGATACRRAAFAVPVVGPVAWALLACVPMALAVDGVRANVLVAVPIGALTWAATLAAALWLAPERVRQLSGILRYP